jgi:hypothetical protein
MKNTHVVVKPFSAEEKGGEVVQPGELFTPRDSTRARDLERLGLIRPAKAKPLAAPQNKTLSLNRRK